MSKRNIIIGLIVLWLATAYFALPLIWRRKEKVAAAAAPTTGEKLPRHSETANGIPGAKLKILPNCGHLPQPEQPQATAEALVEWLRS